MLRRILATSLVLLFSLVPGVALADDPSPQYDLEGPPWLGIMFENSDWGGWEITQVAVAGPAYRAGIRKGDRIIMVAVDRPLGRGTWDLLLPTVSPQYSNQWKALKLSDWDVKAGEVIYLYVLRDNILPHVFKVAVRVDPIPPWQPNWVEGSPWSSPLKDDPKAISPTNP